MTIFSAFAESVCVSSLQNIIYPAVLHRLGLHLMGYLNIHPHMSLRRHSGIYSVQHSADHFNLARRYLYLLFVHLQTDMLLGSFQGHSDDEHNVQEVRYASVNQVRSLWLEGEAVAVWCGWWGIIRRSEAERPSGLISLTTGHTPEPLNPGLHSVRSLPPGTHPRGQPQCFGWTLATTRAKLCMMTPPCFPHRSPTHRSPERVSVCFCLLRCLWLSHWFMLGSQPEPEGKQTHSHTCLHVWGTTDTCSYISFVCTSLWLRLKLNIMLPFIWLQFTHEEKQGADLAQSQGVDALSLCVSVYLKTQTIRKLHMCFMTDTLTGVYHRRARAWARSAHSAAGIDWALRDRRWCHGCCISVGRPCCCLLKGLNLTRWGLYVVPWDHVGSASGAKRAGSLTTIKITKYTKVIFWDKVELICGGSEH